MNRSLTARPIWEIQFQTYEYADRRWPPALPPQCSRSQYQSPPRESNDTPSSDAFFRVAPSVRLSDFAIFAAGFRSARSRYRRWSFPADRQREFPLNSGPSLGIFLSIVQRRAGNPSVQVSRRARQEEANDHCPLHSCRRHRGCREHLFRLAKPGISQILGRRVLRVIGRSVLSLSRRCFGAAVGRVRTAQVAAASPPPTMPQASLARSRGPHSKIGNTLRTRGTRRAWRQQAQNSRP